MKHIVLVCLFISTLLSLQAQVDNAAITVEVSGTGTPILLLPGFTVPGSSWSPIVETLSKNHECHVVTLAGFGGKDPIAFPWLPKVNEALLSYLESEGLQNVTIIGHSLGGTIATWLASRPQTSVSQLVLVDALPAAGALMIPNYDPNLLQYESVFNEQQLAMNEANFELMATQMSQGMSLLPEAQEQIKQWILEADRKTYVYGYTDYLKLDMRADLKKIDIPVTILAATHPYGKEMATQTYQDQYANLVSYDFIVAEDAAHFIMLDQPDWFLEQIQRILQQP